ncbi:hypothetical protein EDB83DRAFT_2520886 [Lactarius deliciosus]|nr:hypothetical protein EDB83DRAFT_2520886 [Lactarius deliciosus]
MSQPCLSNELFTNGLPKPLICNIINNSNPLTFEEWVREAHHHQQKWMYLQAHFKKSGTPTNQTQQQPNLLQQQLQNTFKPQNANVMDMTLGRVHVCGALTVTTLDYFLFSSHSDVSYLEVKTGAHYKQMCFLITDLGDKDLILGYPWLLTFEPQFSWKDAIIDTKALPIMVQSLNWQSLKINLTIMAIKTSPLLNQVKEALISKLKEECTI